MNKRIIEEIRKIEKSLAVISSILEEGKAEEIRFEVSKKPSVIKVTEQEVTKLIHQLGIPANIKGYNYIRTAIMMSIRKPDILYAITKELYPELAKTYNDTSSRVERAIRHAIVKSIERMDINLLTEIFGNSISTNKGCPSNSEYLAAIVDYYKLQQLKK